MMADEEEEGQLDEYNVVEISDDEEKDEPVENDEYNRDDGDEVQLLSAIQDPTDDSEDDSALLPLPTEPQAQVSDGQRPQRKRKRRRDDDQYEYPKQKR
ncbi:unnamed protein product [Penicillium salamii]|nr:unnamed protein product [Penicillium salamii]